MRKALACYLQIALVALPSIPWADATAAMNGNPPPQEALQPRAITQAPAPRTPMEACAGLPLVDKEACYARQAPDLLAECERMRAHHCAPYAKVHELEKELGRLNVALLQSAKRVYATYEDNQPGYVKDLEQSLSEADRAWRAYRDADCALDPLIQGMSRQESVDLTEACRADKTAERVGALEERLSAFSEQTDGEQRSGERPTYELAPAGEQAKP